MVSCYHIGDCKSYTLIVRAVDTASFDTGEVHAVYATFALARDAEWSGRLFVLDMKESHEEGIGTFVEVKHLAPALVGETVVITAVIDELYKNVVNCSFTATVGSRLIAEGRTGQKIIDKAKLVSYFASLTS
jgi:fluoroacetyl-CoA thioesterase